MNRSRPYWVVLFLASGLLTLFFLGKLGVDLYRFYRLTAQAKAEIEEWQIQEISDSKFVLEAKYTYALSGRVYEGRHAFLTTPFPNEFAAQDSLPHWKEKSWRVWYDQKRPSISSLQKVFPLRAMVHFVLSLAVLLYFLWLRLFLVKKYVE